MFGLGDDPTLVAPAVERPPDEVDEAANQLATLGQALGPGEREIVGDGSDQAISTLGQRARIWATMRATSSSAPAEASMFERLSLAASSWLPQNTYSGR
jgi:hypothetical protein